MNDNVMRLLEKRYFLRDDNGNLIEHSWEDVAERVSKHIAQAEPEEQRAYWQKVFYDKIANMEIIPSSPALFNCGTKSGQLSSCFVVDIEDNIEGIFHTVAECAKIFQMSGGAGFSMRKIRPKGSPCVSSGSTASGVVSFMHVFNEVVNRVKQGNKRNGALKIDLPVDHPEIFDFIHCKDDQNVLNNMNISVSITNEFIEAVEKDLDWDLKFNGEVYQTVKARQLWNEIITSAWKTGEPGISYQDNMNAGNMNPHLYPEVFGNPCHEFVNIPYSSCNLASVNLVKCVFDGKVNWDKLKENVRICFRMLDDMITVNRLPLERIEEVTKAIRPAGLGTMGLADMLFELGIRYGSKRCLVFTDKLYSFIRETCLEINKELTEERGEYPAWKGSRWDTEFNTKVRCSSMMSIAPNGSIGFIANVNGGIEPVFALVYTRQDNEGDIYYVVMPAFERYLREKGLYNDAILKLVADNSGSIQTLTKYFDDEARDVFVTAADVTPDQHVDVLAVVQKYVDLSISKTVNLPFNATKEDIGSVYLKAGRKGIKGITVYRDKCRDSQVLYTSNVKEEKKRTELGRGDIIQAPEAAPAIRIRLDTGCGKLYLILSYDINGDIIETFIETGSDGGCQIFTEATSRLISLALRGGIPLEKVVDQLNSTHKCGAYMYHKGTGKKVSRGKSCPSAIGLMLLEIQKKIKELKKLGIDPTTINDIIAGVDMSQADVYKVEKPLTKPATELMTELAGDKMLCPECKSTLLPEGGCIVCKNCGYSKCN